MKVLVPVQARPNPVSDNGQSLSDQRASVAALKLAQDSMKDSSRTRQLMVMQAVATGGGHKSQKLATTAPTSPVAQLENVEVLEDMPDEVKQAVVFLNYLGDENISPSMAPVVAKCVALVESSKFAAHCKPLTDPIKERLPEIVQTAEAVDLQSQSIHSIWVQGDYSADDEFRNGIARRKNTKAVGWQNLIWIYQSAKENEPQFQTVDKLMFRTVSIDDFGLKEVDFSATMSLWDDKPDWVESFMPILDILLEKKSYVAMSDIMRMIILYYSGGLYQDVKIELTSPEAQFFDAPKVNADKLQLVDGTTNAENWAMVAQAGCDMIDKIMRATLVQFPSLEKLRLMPENYSKGGKVGSSHVKLHENKGPWNQIEKHRDKADRISEVNDSLKLINPRPINSWADAADDGFNWD